MSEPMDMTELFNTQLTPAEEQQYGAWARKIGHERDTFDYDLRGAWKADAHAATNGHFTDVYKKPNHPTFSVESKFNGVEGMTGGRWVQTPKGAHYYASPTNLQQYAPSALMDYFKRTEPDVQLILPSHAP